MRRHPGERRRSTAVSYGDEPHRCARHGLGRAGQVRRVDHRDHRVAPVVGWSARKTTGRPSGGTWTAPSTIPSLGSSPARERSRAGPSVRSPMRLLAEETA